MKTIRILKTLHVVVWIIFIGLCISTGSFIYTTILSLTKNPAAAENIYLGIGASNLLEFSRFHFVFQFSLATISLGLKATLFYCLIKIISRINIVHPFHMEIAELITRVSAISLSIGIILIIGEGHLKWILKNGVELPHYRNFTGGATEFLLV